MDFHMATAWVMLMNEVQRFQIEIFRGFIEDYDSNDVYLVSCLGTSKFIPKKIGLTENKFETQISHWNSHQPNPRVIFSALDLWVFLSQNS